MHLPISGRTLRRAGMALAGAAAALVLPLAVAASAASPTVTISPAPVGGPPGNIPDQTQVTVSVAPNATFTPGATVNVLECADPGGSAANLPTDETTCDGNTIQAQTVFVGSDGSFRVTNYPIYALPSTVLGENAAGQPKCDATDACVLFIGQDQGDFTQPKTFSAPFFVAPYPQAITFTSTPPNPAQYGGTYTVSAQGGGSGNPVVFSSATPGVCSVSGSAVSFVGLGTCTVDADQAGNAQYQAAPTARQTFTVGRAATVLTAAPSTVTENVTSWTATVSATLRSQATGAALAGQTITFSTSGLLSALLGTASCSAVTNSSGVATCTMSGVLLHPLTGGSTYSASYAGAMDYAPSSGSGAMNG